MRLWTNSALENASLRVVCGFCGHCLEYLLNQEGYRVVVTHCAPSRRASVEATLPQGHAPTKLDEDSEKGRGTRVGARNRSRHPHIGSCPTSCPYALITLERLGGGLGIMADDLLAGFYAAAVTSLLISIHLLF